MERCVTGKLSCTVRIGTKENHTEFQLLAECEPYVTSDHREALFSRFTKILADRLVSLYPFWSC